MFLSPSLSQLIPQISSLAWYTTVVPLMVVLSITAVKDAIDDMVKWLPGPLFPHCTKSGWGGREREGLPRTA